MGIMIWSHQEKETRAGQALSSALVTRAFSRTESPEAILSVATTYAGTQAGAQALLLGAGELFAGGKPVEAQAQFERFLREYPSHPFAAQANLGLAASIAAGESWTKPRRPTRVWWIVFPMPTPLRKPGSHWPASTSPRENWKRPCDCSRKLPAPI